MPVNLDTPFNQCTFLTSHNAFVNKTDGWEFYQQEGNILEQLNNGIRAFMIDIWYADVYGNYDIYLLHGGWQLKWLYPNFKFQTFKDFLKQVAIFLNENPDEIVTIILETGKDTKTTEGIKMVKKIKAVFDSIIFDPTVGGFGQTLRQIIAGGKRLVILSDYRGADTHSLGATDMFGFPLVWHYARENKYGDESLDLDTWVDPRDESKESQSPDISLSIMNHFPSWLPGMFILSGFEPNPNEPAYPRFLSELFNWANGYNFLAQHLIYYKQRYGEVPNFIGLDMFNIGAGTTQKFKDFIAGLRQNNKKTVSIMGTNGYYLGTSAFTSRNPVYCNGNRNQALQFELIGTFDNCVLKVKGYDLYLNYTNITGQVELYYDKSDANFKLIPIGNGTYKIYSIDQEDYMWLYNGVEPYVTSSGKDKTGFNYWFLEIDGVQPVFTEVQIQPLSKEKAFLTPKGGLRSGAVIYQATNVPVTFEMIGPWENCFLRVKGKNLFLTYGTIRGEIYLSEDPTQANYNISVQQWVDGVPYYTIYSVVTGNRLTYTDTDVIFRWPTTTGYSYFWTILLNQCHFPPIRIFKIKSAKNHLYWGAASMSSRECIYCNVGSDQALQFVEVLKDNKIGEYLAVDYKLYLNYRNVSGAIELYEEVETFEFAKLANGNYSIRNIYYNQYVWLWDDGPYLTSKGDPNNIDAQWILEEVPYFEF